MTTTSLSTSMDALNALLDERRRYEAWLAQLEAKRTETPTHVFDKVGVDTRTQLIARIA